jgi:hypothetical protein
MFHMTKRYENANLEPSLSFVGSDLNFFGHPFYPRNPWLLLRFTLFVSRLTFVPMPQKQYSAPPSMTISVRGSELSAGAVSRRKLYDGRSQLEGVDLGKSATRLGKACAE